MKPKIWRRDWSRRAVSLLLALALLASLLPGTVTAASGEDITAAKEANLAYYERKSEYSPLTAKPPGKTSIRGRKGPVPK